MEEELQCSICLNAIEIQSHPVITFCRHIYCMGCLDPHFDLGKTTCPDCRKELFEEGLFELTEEDLKQLKKNRNYPIQQLDQQPNRQPSRQPQRQARNRARRRVRQHAQDENELSNDESHEGPQEYSRERFLEILELEEETEEEKKEEEEEQQPQRRAKPPTLPSSKYFVITGSNTKIIEDLSAVLESEYTRDLFHECLIEKGQLRTSCHLMLKQAQKLDVISTWFDTAEIEQRKPISLLHSCIKKAPKFSQSGTIKHYGDGKKFLKGKDEILFTKEELKIRKKENKLKKQKEKDALKKLPSRE